MPLHRVSADSQVKGFQLSPIAFPSPMDLLFGLVILTIVGSALLVGEPANLFRGQGSIDPLSLLPISPWYRTADRLLYAFQWLFFPALATLSCGIYLLWWRRNVKQHNLTELPAKQTKYLRLTRRIAQEMKLASSPVILWTNNNQVYMPRVFWRGRHILIIPRSFTAKFNQHPKERRAILYHELAHIRNGDVWKTIIVQCLSIAYLIVAGSYVSAHIVAAIPEWYHLGSTMTFFIRRFIPLLLSGGVLAYLNIVILREREIWADVTAAYYLKDSLVLRKALVRSASLIANPVQPSLFGRLKRVVVALSRFAKLHPSSTLRNQYLFDFRRVFVPRIEMVFIAGFVSVLTVEVSLRSVGLEPVGWGWAPFLSLTLNSLVGFWSLAVSLVPLYVRDILSAENLGYRTTSTVTLGYSLIWAVGAICGGIVSVPVLTPYFSNVQSPWSLLISYGVYAPWEIAFMLLFSRLVIQVLLAYPQILTRQCLSVRLILVPLLITWIPVLIWHSVAAVWFDIIDSLGLRAYELQLALGVMSIYTGVVLIGLGVLYSRYAAAHSNSPVAVKLSQPEPSQPDSQTLLLSQSKVVQRLFASKWTIWLLLPLWIMVFLGVKQFHKIDVMQKWAIFELSQTPPSREAPEGYTRYSDSRVGASVAYPKGWIPYKPPGPYEPYLTTIAFLNPEKHQRLHLTTFPPMGIATSPVEMLAIGSLSLTGREGDIDFLIEQSVPISIPTVMGYAHGYSLTVDLPNHRVSQSVLLSLDWNFGGIDYSLSMECYPEDQEQCAEIFAQFVSSFEIVSPDLNISSPVEDSKLYLDSRNQYAFRYPLEWKLFDISTSDVCHIDRGAIIALPDDQPERWTQIGLEPDVIEASISMIVLKLSHFSQPVDIAERLDTWERVNTEDAPNFEEYRVKARHQFTIGQLDAIQSDFDVTYVDGDNYQGNLVLFARGSDLWEILVLCAIDETSECEYALSTVLSTFQFDSIAPRGSLQ